MGLDGDRELPLVEIGGERLPERGAAIGSQVELWRRPRFLHGAGKREVNVGIAS